MLDKIRKIFDPKKRHNEKGQEILDPTPIEIPMGFRRPPSLQEQIAKLIHSHHLQADLSRNGIESFEEADDFDVGDDFDPKSPYEENFDTSMIQEINAGFRETPKKPEGFEERVKTPPRQPTTKKRFKEEKPIDRQEKSEEESFSDDSQ